ncbi:MAG: NAD-dependent epimerase/dehydratase family protein [Candidatus Alcyoniella australis]|nr:NAD-dependent epimerase/dehydratase family protein [Candidatus Alcyoniella australis]
MPEAAPTSSTRRVRGRKHPPTLVTGLSGYAGMALFEQLLADSRCPQVVCIDLERPGFDLGRAKFFRVDLTLPTADALVAEILEEEQIGRVMHAAFLSGPSHDHLRAHELETIGTMHVLNACAAVGVEKIVVPLSTVSYGARADNPNYLTEEHPLRGDPKYPYVRDKIEVEQLLAEHARRYPECCVTVLRAAPVVGPDSSYFFNKYLRRPLMLRLSGYDPLMQFLHQDDLTFALKAALDADSPGAFNIAGRGVVPYSAVAPLVGRACIAFPLALARTLSAALWPVYALPFDPRYLEYLRYLFVADISKAEGGLGFSPRYSSREALLSVS